jgi:hypothetical protein
VAASATWANDKFSPQSLAVSQDLKSVAVQRYLPQTRHWLGSLSRVRGE